MSDARRATGDKYYDDPASRRTVAREPASHLGRALKMRIEGCGECIFADREGYGPLAGDGFGCRSDALTRARL